MNDGSITYTVKELISMLEKTLTTQINTIVVRLDELDDKLDGKVSEMRLRDVERNIQDNQKRIAILEITSAGQQAVSKFQRWLIGSVAVGVFGAVCTLVYYAVTGVHG